MNCHDFTIMFDFLTEYSKNADINGGVVSWKYTEKSLIVKCNDGSRRIWKLTEIIGE